jgi:UDP-N-acetylmuramoyl-tripeptide--D-alanyl-D-alanine ligase
VSPKFLNIKELYEIFVQFPFICTDTRNIIPNSLFFCLKGAHFDGNLFVNEALEKGAGYVITEESDNQKAEGRRHENIIFVDNVLKTLQQLANYHRNQLKIPVIGITGTNGKTTTKELIAAVLSKKYKVAYTQGNLNNHIGVPLTLLSIKKEEEIAVIEMGANHTGEIDELCQIAQPDYGLITNIGKAHLEGFGSIENIIETKTALYRAAQVLFVNAEDEVLMQKAESRKLKAEKNLTVLQSYSLTVSKTNIIFYGKNTTIDGTILEMNPCLVLDLLGKKIQTHLTGNYNLPNILGAAAIGNFFGVSHGDICEAIANYEPQNHRSQVIKSGANTIIADYYNANPSSMKAALDNFLQMEAPRKWALLGDMLELGENSVTEHQAIIDFCKEKNIDTIFIGPTFYSLKNEHAHFFMNVEDCNAFLKEKISPSKFEGVDGEAGRGSFILIKGSRGIHLENLFLLTTN